jgi:hypothetical protein
MTSTNSLPQNPEVVAAIERTFQDVWAVLYAHLPLDGGDAVKEQSIALSQTLVALAADGITDPRELRRKALEAMVLTPR